jgi:hypothetical protein
MLRIPSEVEGLKASFERRPERPESKSFDRLRTLSEAEGPFGRIVHENNKDS